ncbi:hypothetical protein F5880DRAFT_1703471 [Lentinula raphanica]|nr:hypothetical protein F5880DRAFT_1703471 [Lentinula raphanica]
MFDYDHFFLYLAPAFTTGAAPHYQRRKPPSPTPAKCMEQLLKVLLATERTVVKTIHGLYKIIAPTFKTVSKLFTISLPLLTLWAPALVVSKPAPKMHPSWLSCVFVLLISILWASAHSANGRDEDAETDDTICAYVPYKQLQRRATDDSGNGTGVGVGVGVDVPSVGLTLGNITTKLGNINLTVTNVTISVGNIDIENITIGNISVIVSVPLPGASPINAFSASTVSQSIATSTASATSTVSPSTTVSQTATGLFRMKRQDSSSELTTITPTPTSTSGVGLPSPTVSASVGGGPVGIGAGNVDTEIGNITIFVGNVNVSVGDVNIKNVSVGNIFILVQIGQPDLTGAIGNLTSQLGA